MQVSAIKLPSVVLKNPNLPLCSTGECQQVLAAESGTFSSPRFPNIYPNNINCHWGITQAPGYRIKLFFPFLDLEERNNLSGECDYDSVTVYDGDSQADPMLGRWCGGERPPSLVSRGNKLLVVLSTDRNEAHRGFTAAYLGGKCSPAAGVICCWSCSCWGRSIYLREQLFLIYDPLPQRCMLWLFCSLFLPTVQVVPVNVSCTRSEFTILIPQQSLPRLDRESIYLGNPTCAAQLTSTAYKILAQFVNCGTAGQVTIVHSFTCCCFCVTSRSTYRSIRTSLCWSTSSTSISLTGSSRTCKSTRCSAMLCGR